MRAAKNITILLLLITVLLAAKMFMGYPMLLDFSTDEKLVRTEDYSMGDTISPFKHFDFSKGDWKAYILIHKNDSNFLPSEMGEGVLKTTDKHLLQCMKHTWKFIYTGGDVATVQSEIILCQNGILVFRSGIVLDSVRQGMQSIQYGWLEVTPRRGLTAVCKEFKKVYSPLIILR